MKYCSDVIKKNSNKELVNATKCWICDNDYIDNGVKVRDHCISLENIEIRRDYKCNVKLTHKIPVIFHNLKNYNLNLQINVIPNGLEKYVSFSINNKLSFIDSFQFLSSLLDGLAKNLYNVDFEYLS